MEDLESLFDWIYRSNHWLSHLLQDIHLHVSEAELESLLVGNLSIKFAKSASDGGCKHLVGTYGWAIRCGGKIVVTGAGTLPFVDTQNSSFRGEAYGVASVSWFIVSLLLFFHHTLPSSIHWQFWCDNLGLVTRINNHAANQHKLRDLTATDADMCLCALKGLSRLGNYSLHHVKGHQDSSCKQKPLSVEAQLNIKADELATLQRRDGRSSNTMPFLPGADIQLYIQQRLITTRIDRAIQFASTTPKLRLYMESKYDWDASTADRIDWDAHGASLRHLSAKHRLIILKYIHGWLPTAKQANRYSPGISPECPHCRAPAEDNYHFISCQHQGPKEHWELFAIKFRRCLQRQHTETTIQAMILFHLSRLLQINQRAPTWSHTPQWVTDQSSIGWPQLLFGRIAISMVDRQQDHLSSLSIDHRRHNGDIWAKRIISSLWQHIISLWHFRCDKMYGTSLTDKIRIQKTQLMHTVERLHAQKHILPIGDHSLFPPLVDLKKKRLSTLETWISMVEPLITHYQNNPQTHPALEHRPPITRYFPRR